MITEPVAETPFWLEVNGRVSGGVALKVSRAGLSWVATRSVPTTLALTVPRSAGLTILAGAAGPDARRFAPDADPSPGDRR